MLIFCFYFQLAKRAGEVVLYSSYLNRKPSQIVVSQMLDFEESAFQVAFLAEREAAVKLGNL